MAVLQRNGGMASFTSGDCYEDLQDSLLIYKSIPFLVLVYLVQ